MKYKLTSLLALLLWSGSALAQEISADDALSNALAKLSTGRNKVKASALQKQSYRLAHTQMPVTPTAKQAPLYYVFENTDGGFIVAGADQRTSALLGTIEAGTYSEALKVPAFRYWCETSQRGIEEVVSQPNGAITIDSEGVNTPMRKYVNVMQNVTVVFPSHETITTSQRPTFVPSLLGDINWNQNAPYSDLCPTLSNGNKAATGCVATATAQIMKYYEWPETGEGSNSYKAYYIDKTLSADFSNSRYDWANMINNYDKSNYTPNQANAVAKLMSDIGIAENMNYGPSSSAQHEDAVKALADHFRYDKSLRCCYRSHYTRSEWYQMICNEIANKRPVLMCGTNYSDYVGHAFVIDGYDASGLVHVNWGWGGISNGFFSLDYMHPSNQGTGGSNGGYGADQSICIGIQPDRTGTSTGTSEIATLSPIKYDSSENTVSFCYSNYGQKPFNGNIGVVVMRTNSSGTSTYYSKDFTSESNLGFNTSKIFYTSLDYLGIDYNYSGSDQFLIYPAYEVNGEYVILDSPLNNAECLRLYYDPNQRKMVFADNLLEKSNPRLESINIVRNYVGYDAVISAKISVPENCAELSNPLYAIVTDASTGWREGNAYSYRLIQPGETADVQFTFPQLKAGINYNVCIYQCVTDLNGYALGPYLFEIDNYQAKAFTMQTSAQANISYIGTDLAGKKFTEGKTISCNVILNNTGGYGEIPLLLWLYRQNGNNYESESYISYSTYSIESGQHSITLSGTADVPAGHYIGQICQVSGGYADLIDEKEFDIYPSGDVNYDGMINKYDADALTKMVIRQSEVTESGDVNTDNAISVGDITSLVKKLK